MEAAQVLSTTLIIATGVLLLFIFLKDVLSGIKKRDSIGRAIDTTKGIMFVVPSKKTSDERVKEIVDKYSSDYDIKIVDHKDRVGGL